MKKILFFAFVLTLFAGCKHDEYQKIEEELLNERIKLQEKCEYDQQQKKKSKRKEKYEFDQQQKKKSKRKHK